MKRASDGKRRSFTEEEKRRLTAEYLAAPHGTRKRVLAKHRLAPSVMHNWLSTGDRPVDRASHSRSKRYREPEEKRALLAEYEDIPLGEKAAWLAERNISYALMSTWRKCVREGKPLHKKGGNYGPTYAGNGKHEHEPDNATKAALFEQRQRLEAATGQDGHLASRRVLELQRELSAARAVIKYLEARIEELS